MAKLKPNQVKYLSFEGGGGKGFAYFWALLALSDDRINIFQKDGPPNNTNSKFYLNNSQIKGVSGSSAGAILATLIASGLSLEDICMLIFDDKKLKKLEEAPGENSNRVYPKVLSAKGYESEERIKKTLFDIIVFPLYKLPDLFKRLIVNFILEMISPELHKHLVAYAKDNNLSEEALLKRIENDLACDFGVISGRNILDVVNKLLKDSVIAYLDKIHISVESDVELKKIRKSIGENHRITFKQHYKVFGIELVLSGVNLLTQESFYFSYKTTPNLCVSDALRISMSIPNFFKPVLINESDARKMTSNPEYVKKLIGLWVDGGTINNLPIHVFDNSEKLYQRGNLNPFVLGFSFQDIEGAKVPISYNLLDVVGSTKDILLQNMTNLQYNSKEDLDHIISVDKGTLSTFSFVPSYFSLLSSYKSYQFTLDYFNLKNGNLMNNLSISETLKQRINKDITLIQNEK